jgi:catalase
MAASNPGEARETVAYGDEQIERGHGGETHQVAGGGRPVLTTQQGVPVADDQNTLRVGERGPDVLEDFHFREKIFHFDHERIPERVVHARGYGVHGYFENYEPLTGLTRADPFSEAGLRTPVFVRFSTVAGNKGSTDLARDVRGFATKFYTRQGNWDLVGNNIPVFFIQDAIKFPDVIHAAKQEPDRGFPQAQTAHDNFWDFVSLMPESTHMLMWIMSDRAIPRSFRFMEGFGVHTFRLVNAEGQSTFVKFHWKPKQGLQSVVWNEAVKISGADPDFHRRDMWDAIQRGDIPEWELGLQLFDDDFADRFAFDVLDPTKIIPEEEVPVRRVGRMVLDRLPENFFAETEQVAFCTQNVVPGIDFTNDPLLQGRNFSYLDTQLKRLGSPNFTQLPINAPKCPYATLQQDGQMATVNPVSRANYEPNSWSAAEGGPREDPATGFRSCPSAGAGGKRRLRPGSFADHYSQAGQFYRSQTEVEQQHIADAFTFELSKCDRSDIRSRMVAGLRNVDQNLAQSVADALGLDGLPEAAPAARAVTGDRLSRPRSASCATARRASPTGRSTAARRCCMTPWSCCAPRTGLASWRATRPHGTSSPTRTPTTSSSGTALTLSRCSPRPASARSGTTASSSSATAARPPTSWPPAGSSGSGTAPPLPEPASQLRWRCPALAEPGTASGRPRSPGPGGQARQEPFAWRTATVLPHTAGLSGPSMNAGPGPDGSWNSSPANWPVPAGALMPGGTAEAP